MKDRILQIMHREGLTPARFAEVINVQRSAVSHIMTGRNNPSLDVVMKILDKYPYVDPDWLLYGKGEIIRKNTSSAAIQSDLFSPTPPKAPVIPPRSTAVAEKHRETEVEKPQNIIRQTVQEPVIIKKTEQKNVSKIMIFYSDNTFETFIPEKIKKD
ncbi:MAG: helix-turn-helix domain-containing protein [Tannerellaceae bacterium]|jgi:transcriptional regulator with XRE-family HTH domain|nr:helix-turn-helix domain-containing protein [Tannerellaceae bacterium]